MCVFSKTEKSMNTAVHYFKGSALVDKMAINKCMDQLILFVNQIKKVKVSHSLVAVGALVQHMESGVHPLLTLLILP